MSIIDWLPPATIIIVVIFANGITSNALNKRIDDLREDVLDIRKMLLDHITNGHGGKDG